MFPALPVDLQSLQSLVLGFKATYIKKKMLLEKEFLSLLVKYNDSCILDVLEELRKLAQSSIWKQCAI